METETEVTPNSTLREVPLKRCLKTFIVSHVIEKYMTVGIRVLWEEKDFSDMYEKRLQLEQLLTDIKEVVLIINCVTAMTEKETTKTGFCFWIAYDYPEVTSYKFEAYLCKKIMEKEIEISSCKGVKGRGKLFIIICFICF